MKKTTLLLLFLFLSIFTFSQQLLSSREQFFTGSDWEDSYGYNYEYDSNNRLVSSTELMFNGTVWEPIFRDFHTYNTNSIVTVFQDYNSTTEQFEDDFRTVFNYDTNSKIQEMVDQSWDGSNWVNDGLYAFNYVNGQIDTIIYQSWNGTTYEVEYRNRIEYNGNNELENFILEEWNGSSWLLMDRDRVEYDANGFIDLKVLETWNGASYEEDEREEYNYSANGNRLTEAIVYNGSTSSYSYSYDTSAEMSNIANPFVDFTGIKYQTESFPYFNKVLSRTNTNNQERIIYDYQNSITLSTDTFESVKFSVFPNPANDVLNVEASVGISKIEIYNILGKNVLNTKDTTISVSSLKQGIYLLKIYDDNHNMETRKFIKE